MRRWKRSTWPAVSTMTCLPVKNGWQLLQMSTRSSGRVDPTVNSVPQEAQWTRASWYLGWMFGFTGVLAQAPAAGVVSAGSTRTRFLLRVACSNRTFPVTVAKIV